MKKTLDINQFKPGMQSSYIRKISESDVHRYAEITGDDNPLHIDKEFSEKSIFKKQVVHGMLVASFFSKIFGTQFPGNGCIYLAQEISFKKPVFLEDTVRAEVTLDVVDLEKSQLVFTTRCYVDEFIVITGTARIYIPT